MNISIIEQQQMFAHDSVFKVILFIGYFSSQFIIDYQQKYHDTKTMNALANQHIQIAYIYIIRNLRSMSEEMIELKLDTARQKLREQFPIDPKSDISISYKNLKFKLQKAYLRLQSTFFQNSISPHRAILELSGDFQEESVYNIMHLFYGASVEIQRIDVFHYFPVIKYLGIQSLIRCIKRQITENIIHYDLFEVFELAMREQYQEIFEQCLRRLEQDRYSQLKTNKESLLRTPEEIFNLVIKSYFQSDGNKIMTVYEIVDLINEYAGFKSKKKKEYARVLKFQLIDISKLNAKEYNDVFLVQEINLSRSGSSRKERSSSGSNEEQLDKPSLLSLNQSSSQLNNSNRARTLQMQRTLQRKITVQLTQQKQQIVTQFDRVKQGCRMQLNRSTSIQQELSKLRSSFSNKEEDGLTLSKKLDEMNKKILEIQNKMMKTGDILERLKESAKYVDDKREIDGVKLVQMESSCIQQVQQQIEQQFDVPDLKPIKIQQLVQQIHHTGLNDDQIQFLSPPITIKSQQQFLCLKRLILSDRFKKNKLNLLLRRTKKDSYGHKDDIKEQGKSLLFLIRTQDDKLVGARIYENIGEDCESLYDNQAYLFSVDHQEKFKVKEDCAEEAAQFSKDFIICFSTDLMIPQLCLQQQGYCQWPNSYQGKAKLEKRGSQWLVGCPQFQIKQLQCYSIELQGVQMML